MHNLDTINSFNDIMTWRTWVDRLHCPESHSLQIHLKCTRQAGVSKNIIQKTDILLSSHYISVLSRAPTDLTRQPGHDLMRFPHRSWLLFVT